MYITALTTLTLALFAGQAIGNPHKCACLNTNDAQTLADNFALFTSAWTVNATYSEELLKATYAEEFHDFSDSVRVLESAGCTNGPQPLDSSRDQFAADQLNVPPFEFNVMRVWHSCDTVTLLWQRPSADSHRTRGLVVLETVPAPRHSKAKRLVSAVYSEFNTASWFVDQGIFMPKGCEGASAPVYE